MKKAISFCCACILLAGLLSGCKGQDKATTSGLVTVGGSTSMEKVIGGLSEAFMIDHKEIAVTYTPSGSGAGISGAVSGVVDIGLSSRNLKEKETGLEAFTIALDGIAIIVNKENSVMNLTQEQIAQMATGEITNWNQVGGIDRTVVFYGREAGSGTRDGFESVLGVAHKSIYAGEYNATGGIVAAVYNNPGGIGYVSLASDMSKVKTLDVNGVVASEATVQDGSYTIQRPFLMVMPSRQELSPDAAQFLDFCLSEQAEEIIRLAGAIPAKQK